MLYHNVMVMAHYRRLVDTFLVGAAAIVARSVVGESTTPTLPIVVFSGVLALSFAVLGARFRVYRARRTEHLRGEIGSLVEALVYSLGIGCLVTEITTSGLTGSVYLGTLFFGTASLLAVHGAMRIIIRRLRRAGREYRIWLIVGRNERTAAIARNLLDNRHFGVRIAAIVDLAAGEDDRHQSVIDGFTTPPLEQIPQRVLTDIREVQEILETQVIDEVLVTLPLRSQYDAVQEVLRICGAAGISVKLSTETFTDTATRVHMEYVGNIPMVTHFNGPVQGFQLMIKRALDVAASATALVALAPVFAVVAARIRAGSKGPVFFRQIRVGLHGRQFTMLKFRTMVQDASERKDDVAHLNSADAVVFKVRDDPRVTAIGKWLRAYHLDELPQLWNVLVGDMSLVGPRALPIGEAIGNEWWQRRRLSMPPGLTCHWQLRERRHIIPHRQWMRLDLEYIDTWSVWLDLRLIARTVLMLPRGTGW